MVTDLFQEMNNALIDIQTADYQGIDRPLRNLSRLLHHPDLESANQRLIEGVDLDKFLKDSELTAGGMAGGDKLTWPEDRRQDLGLRLLLVRKLGDEDRNFAFQFSHTYYGGSSAKIMTGFNGMNRQLIIPFVRDYQTYVLSQGNNEVKLIRTTSKRIFIVHGRDGEARETVARFLGNIGFDPIILHEQANRGRTIIEKVEDNSDVGFAVVLLTPDDVGRHTPRTSSAFCLIYQYDRERHLPWRQPGLTSRGAESPSFPTRWNR